MGFAKLVPKSATCSTDHHNYYLNPGYIIMSLCKQETKVGRYHVFSGVASISAAILPSYQGMTTFALQLHNHKYKVG